MDLNSDLGEGAASDTELLAIVTSVNIACGYHAGDAGLMRATVREALWRGVAIGAHPGYHDREGFGRRELSLSPHRIESDVLAQLRELEAICTPARKERSPGSLLLPRFTTAGERFPAAAQAPRPPATVRGGVAWQQTRECSWHQPH